MYKCNFRVCYRCCLKNATINNEFYTFILHFCSVLNTIGFVLENGHLKYIFIVFKYMFYSVYWYYC